VIPDEPTAEVANVNRLMMQGICDIASAAGRAADDCARFGFNCAQGVCNLAGSVATSSYREIEALVVKISTAEFTKLLQTGKLLEIVKRIEPLLKSHLGKKLAKMLKKASEKALEAYLEIQGVPLAGTVAEVTIDLLASYAQSNTDTPPTVHAPPAVSAAPTVAREPTQVAKSVHNLRAVSKDSIDSKLGKPIPIAHKALLFGNVRL
jgi:hypothetical protein